MDTLKIFTLTLLLLLFFIGSVSAITAHDIDTNQTIDNSSLKLDESPVEAALEDQSLDDSVSESDPGVIVVNDWEDLQYYCSLSDKNYVLKLKENTNFYPTDVLDSNYQIIIKNNVTIIGSQGSYIGDSSPQAANITYNAIKVEDNSGIGVTLENITFKWIASSYQSDGVFITLAGNVNNYIKNCYFTNISTYLGHSSIVHIKRGKVTLTNCTFINCTTDFGCLSVYDPKDDPTKTCTGASMEVSDSYFEGNYARTEPGCINNCGILVVNNTTFYKNSAFWWAGAIHTHGGANTTIYDSDFIDNVAGWNGGALYTYSYLQIYNSRFIGNNCTTNNGGGAIGACKYLHAPYVYIEGSLFKDNENTCWGLSELSTTGTGRGGAISFMDEGSLEVYNNTFIHNSASIGTAICAIAGGLSFGSPDVKIIGNQFINHTRVGDALDIRLATTSIAEIRDNYYLNNSFVFEKLKLTADDPVDGQVTFHIDVSLKNPKSFDEDILDKFDYYVYVDGVYEKSVSTLDFTLNFEKGKTAYVYVVPSISNSKSNEVFAGIAKTYIFVSQIHGSDNNNGLSRDQPVKTLNKSIELAKSHENIIIMDGVFTETNLHIDYNLTILAESGVSISVTGNAFTITDGDVKFVNVTFKNCKYGASGNRLILQNNNGFLIFEGSNFQNNDYKLHIEAKGSIEAEHINVSNNKDGSFIRCDSIVVKSSIFANNIATYDNLNSLLVFYTQTVKLEIEDVIFSRNSLYRGCISLKKGSGTVTACTFESNIMNTSNGKASAIYTEESSSLVVQSCKFINNKDTGKYSSVIYVGGALVIKDSILINNSYENTNNLIISGSESGLKKLIANNNWWGNTPDNLTKPALKVYASSFSLPNGWDPASTWLILNATSITTELELNERFPVQFIFTQIDNEGNITDYDSYYLPIFDLDLTAAGGVCDDNKVNVEKGVATTYFTLTNMSGGSLTGSFYTIDSIINFQFIKSNPTLIINVSNITVGDSCEIIVSIDSQATGNITLKIGNITQTKEINTHTTFTIENLAVGNYTVEVDYAGNGKYNSVLNTTRFSVNKASSAIEISQPIRINDDMTFTFNITRNATGTIDVYVNNQKYTINVGENFTIFNIARGNYLLKAVYSGDNNHFESEDEIYFEVDKFAPLLTVNVSDITYGNDTVVIVSLNDDATGNVSVTIDEITKSSQINNGKAIITISNLNAGENKLVEVFYTGDNNYNKSTVTKTFNIAKAKLDFTITSSDINIGKDAIIEIILPARCGGTITLTGIETEVKNVPPSGVVKVTYSDLENGTYTISARYDGENYQTISKSVSFTVSLWNEAQWANEGGDIKHTGKSPYDSIINGQLIWFNIVGNITGNLGIDSEGNLYVVTQNTIYSFDNNGNLRWNYSSSGAGRYFSGISISRDVVISPNADDTLYFVNQTTGEHYGHANLYQGSSYFAPIVDLNGNIYISGQGDANNPNLVIIPYKNWENGGNPIVIPLGSSPIASPTVIDDTYVVVPCEDAIKVVDISSKTIVTSKIGIAKGYSVIGDGNIIYSILGDSIVAFTVSGDNLWNTKVTGGVGNQLTIDTEQGIYAVNANGQLYKYDIFDGSESLFTNLTVTSGILIGSDGNIYFAANNVFYALDFEGNILWKSILDSKIISTPIMDKNGMIYINSANKVYALNKSSLKDVNLSINSSNINVGQSETITITLNENATGLVEITINNATYQEEILNGKIIKTFNDLTYGEYTVTVRYLGDLRYASSSLSAKFAVLRYNPNITVESGDINVGDIALFNVKLNQDASGIIYVLVDGKNCSSNLVGGLAKITVEGLTSGIKEAIICYGGDGQYLPVNTSYSISVNKHDSPISINVDDIDYGAPAILEVILPQNATGSVKLIIENTTLIKNITDSKAEFIINNLQVGEKTVNIIYLGDTKFKENSTISSFNVKKANPKMVYDIPTICVGQTLKLTINLLTNETGKITILVGSINQTGIIDNSKVSFDISNLDVGNHTLQISYSGDNNHNSVIINDNIIVLNKIPTVINITLPEHSYYKDKINIHVNININSGNLSIYLEGIENIVKIINGNVDYSLDAVGGNHSVNVVYRGDETYAPASQVKSFEVAPLSTVISDIIVSKDLKIHAVLKDSKGDPVSNTLITYVAEGIVKNITTADDGSFTIESKEGQTVYIYFNGNNNLLASNVSVSVNNTTIISLDCHFNINNGVKYNVYAIDYDAGERGNALKFQLLDSNNDAIKGVNVKFSYGKTIIYKTTDDNGIISFDLNIQSSGVYQSSLYYEGNEIYNSTSVSFSIKVNKKPISITANKKTFKAKTKIKKYTIALKTSVCSSKNGKVYLKAGKKVTLKIKGKTYTAKTNSKGKATFKIKKLIKKAKYTAIIKFNGDSTYNAVTKKVKITIK